MAKKRTKRGEKDTKSRKVRDLPAKILKADAVTPARGSDVRGGLVVRKAGEKPLEYL